MPSLTRMTLQLVHPDLADARLLLGCRDGATEGEVRHAYRRALHQAQPGRVDDGWLAQVQQARDLLLTLAPVDRRRHPRNETIRRVRTSVDGGAVIPPQQPCADRPA
ncbi:MAG: hypothetical protein JWL64_2781 [Frankiales bacterium]|nr:hypothetical protein [Frankiales bacterium]